MTVKFFKTSTELTFYFCWVLVILHCINGEAKALYNLPCMIVLLGCLILNLSEGIDASNKIFRFIVIGIGVIVPVLSFFLLPAAVYSVIPIIPWFYYCFMFFSHRQYMERRDFEKRFKVMLLGLIPLPLVAMYARNLEGLKLSAAVIPWAFMMIMTGIFTLQNLRWKGKQHGMEYLEKKQKLEFALFAVLSVVLAFFNFISRINEYFLSKMVFPAIAYFFAGTFSGIFAGIMKVEELTTPDKTPDEVESFQEMINEEFASLGFQNIEMVGQGVVEKEPVNEFHFNPLWLLVLVAVGILVFLLTGKRKKYVKSNTETEIHEIIEVPKEKNKKYARTDLDTVRSLYLKHMRSVSAFNRIKSSDTTEDICEKAIKSGVKDARSETILTSYYRKARYKNESSHDDLKAMKKML